MNSYKVKKIIGKVFFWLAIAALVFIVLAPFTG